MSFHKYQHVERLDHPNVDGLLVGDCHVYPKLDGTNGCFWFPEGGGVACGSRRVDLSQPEKPDNHGFRQYIESLWEGGSLNELRDAFGPAGYIVYGEWMIPHTLKTYRDSVWRTFWVFDVYDPNTGSYLHPSGWETWIEAASLNVVQPLSIIHNPTLEDLIKIRDYHNTFLIDENQGVGEGIVVKNYAFRNHVGKQVWGKLVRNDFKDENRRAFGAPDRDGSFQVECAIAEEFVTKAFVDKTRAKVEDAVIHEAIAQGSDFDGSQKRQFLEVRRGSVIPRLLQTVYSELLTEETWAFVKKYKDPTINFKTLRRFVTAQVKKHAGDLF